MIQLSGRSIRAVHRLDAEGATRHREDAETALREAQRELGAHPALGVGFLHDAEKEFAEAVLTAALVDDDVVPGHESVGVSAAAWLNGLAEAGSELRRHLLDRLRAGEVERAEGLLGAMDDVYELVVSFDQPDAVTGGLRRSADNLRAVLERSRADLTTAALHARLQARLEQH